MIVNSELPVSMLSENLRLNEYDFVLFHLYKSDPEYHEYYNRMRAEHPERKMFLDNSAYEFFVKGEILDLEEYRDAIIELRPDFYLLPDVLMDKEETFSRTGAFLSLYETDIIKKCNGSIPSPVAVAQGKTPKELVECLLEYHKHNLKFVAIPFHNSFYKEIYDSSVANEFRLQFGKINEDLRYAAGRVTFLRGIEHLLECFDWVHLLGSHQPWEKHFYHTLKIDSMDTGYPVKCGIAGKTMDADKPDIIIDDFLHAELTTQQKIYIESNITRFRNY